MDKKWIFIFLIIFAISLISYIGIRNAEIISDEVPHSEQIYKFISGDFSLMYYLTVIPGYHLIMAGISKIFGLHNLSSFRAINATITIFFFVLFFYITSKDKIKTFQSYFFPLFFVYFFLVYTDLISMLFVLFAYYFYKKEHYILNGLFLAISILIRQNNIFWIGAFTILIFLEHFSIKKIIPQIMVGISFVMFVVFNDFKIVLGTDAVRHPIGFYPANIYFFFVMTFILFFPVILKDFSKIFNIIKQKWYIILGFILIGLGTYKVNHPYNQWMDFLRNRILLISVSNPIFTLIFFLLGILGAVWLYHLFNDNKEMLILFLFGFIQIAMSWLIEVRYYFVLFGLILLNRPIKNNKKEIEIYITIYWLLFSLLMLFGAIKHNVFW